MVVDKLLWALLDLRHDAEEPEIQAAVEKVAKSFGWDGQDPRCRLDQVTR